MESSPSPARSSWALLLILGAIWGSSFMGVAVALDGFGPSQVAATRIVVAAVILTAYAAATGRDIPGRTGSRRIWWHILGFAIFSNALPFTLLGWGMQHVPSGFAGVSMAVVPLLVLPLAHFLVPGERLSWLRGIGFVTGFVGTIVLIGPGAFANNGGTHENLARLACVAAAASYACGAITTRLAPPTGMIAYAAATLVIAALMITPYTLWLEGWPAFGLDRPTFTLMYLAVFPTAIATLMMVHIIRTAGPSFLSLVNYQVPLWSVAFGTILLGEVLPPSLFLALSLILVGLGLSQWATQRATRVATN